MSEQFRGYHNATDTHDIAGFKGAGQINPHADSVESFNSIHRHRNPSMQPFVEHEPVAPFWSVVFEMKFQFGRELWCR